MNHNESEPWEDLARPCKTLNQHESTEPSAFFEFVPTGGSWSYSRHPEFLDHGPLRAHGYPKTGRQVAASVVGKFQWGSSSANGEWKTWKKWMDHLWTISCWNGCWCSNSPTRSHDHMTCPQNFISTQPRASSATLWHDSSLPSRASCRHSGTQFSWMNFLGVNPWIGQKKVQPASFPKKVCGHGKNGEIA